MCVKEIECVFVGKIERERDRRCVWRREKKRESVCV